MADQRAPERCRECREELPFGATVPKADFILWGKLFPPEALGPRCYDHAAKHIGWAGMSQIDQWAVYDLRRPEPSAPDDLRERIAAEIMDLHDGCLGCCINTRGVDEVAAVMDVLRRNGVVAEPEYVCANCGGPITVKDNVSGGLITVNVDGHARPAHRTCRNGVIS